MHKTGRTSQETVGAKIDGNTFATMATADSGIVAAHPPLIYQVGARGCCSRNEGKKSTCSWQLVYVVAVQSRSVNYLGRLTDLASIKGAIIRFSDMKLKVLLLSPDTLDCPYKQRMTLHFGFV